MRSFKLSSIKFSLPSDLIASRPTVNREDTRMMVIDRATGKIEHKLFKDILEYFTESDTIILNTAKVLPLRLSGDKEGAGSGMTAYLIRELDSSQHLWDATVSPARKMRNGNKVIFRKKNIKKEDKLTKAKSLELVGEIVDNTTSRGRTIKFFFDGPPNELYKLLNDLGEAPIPDALDREVIDEDREWYQTVYAKHTGAAVAPSAGFPFTNYLLKALEIKDVVLTDVVLNINPSIFNVIDIEELSKYRSSSEYYKIEKEAANKINFALKGKKKVCAVGISVLKTLESVFLEKDCIKSCEGWSNLFIYPGDHTFKVANTLLTKFHLPGTVPFINVCAFLGPELALEAYKAAIANKYNFFVYGDSMLIL
jgi:S-adenosylmethionine:tRNA ribosyltransferase-isomerase